MQAISTPSGELLALKLEDPGAASSSTKSSGTYLEARGVPYARARRFGRPYPVNFTDFGNPFVADTPAPAAPQFLRGKDGDIRQSVLMSEDCQNLTVSFPADYSAGEKLPVMVYLHGGSYVAGSGDGARYTPARLVLDERVVVVRVTFRLGLLGFLGGSPQRPANLGLLDVREALRWVATHISSFGGDPANVTVFGQSAGGDLATQLLLTEGVVSEGLVRRVISQSAPLDLVNHKESLAKHLLKKTASIADDAPASDFGAASWKNVFGNPLVSGFYPAMMPFGTQYGHYPLPSLEEADSAWRSVAGSVDLLVGANLREAAYFLPRLPSVRGVTEGLIRKGTRDLYQQPARDLIARHRSAGGVGTSYSLAVGHPLHYLYSAHCTELALLFDNPAWEGSKLLAGSSAYERAVQGAALRGIWAEFARSGAVREDLAETGRISFG